MMEGAYGGNKAGAAFDPLAFIQKPQVILRAVSSLFSIIVFGCISSQGWYFTKKNEQCCLYNDDNSACQFGNAIAVIAFIASIGFIVGEYLFEQMPSIKTRKHYVLGDLGFSAIWSFLFFVSFCYLSSQWGNTKVPIPWEGGANNMQAAIAFSFFSIITWGGLAYLAYLRYKQGADQAFAPSYEVEGGNAAGYSSYPDAVDPDGGYAQPPFNSAQQPAGQFSN